ncbi:nuclear transport factor 2 family protein [Flagellimonas algicola]|uniref:Nuclear transport factor 2 family protein n=1 Tax=Flagellimonas algicola TaxID=2583815 RepID=A0ABY2WK61_9FLAO|nr:nuclear transport factor 2 family protein [Allomuricauda algicola]TMU54922.1 nuclear transport factor 2 family protein [Allomuricauda algicola]
MKKTIGILILLCALSACKETPMEPQTMSLITPADHGILRNLKEVQWPKAYREQDTVLLDKILGDDFQMIDASGTWSDKQGELEWIKENAMQHDSFHYEIKRLDVLDNGTALICGTGHIINDSIETIYQSSNILIKRNGMWKAVASHVSGIKQLE